MEKERFFLDNYQVAWDLWSTILAVLKMSFYYERNDMDTKILALKFFS